MRKNTGAAAGKISGNGRSSGAEFVGDIKGIICDIRRGAMTGSDAGQALRGMNIILKLAELQAKYGVASEIIGNKAA